MSDDLQVPVRVFLNKGAKVIGGNGLSISNLKGQCLRKHTSGGPKRSFKGILHEMDILIRTWLNSEASFPLYQYVNRLKGDPQIVRLIRATLEF